MPGSDSRVTITLDLVGQKAVVDGLGEVTDALGDLGAAAEGAGGEVTEAMGTIDADVAATGESVATSATATAASIRDIGAATEETAVTVSEADGEIGDAMDTMAAQTATAVDALLLSMGRMKDGVTGAAGDVAATLTGSGTGGGKGVLGALGDFKTLLAGGAVYESLKVYGNYQSGLYNLATMAGLAHDKLSGLNKFILATANGVGVTPVAFANALYSPLSEGFNLSGSKNIAQASARLSDMSGAPLYGTGSTSYTMSVLLHDLNLSATPGNVAKVAALMRGGVQVGDFQLGDLTAAASTGIFSAGQTYGVTPTATIGALDYLSTQGIPAQSAAYRLGMFESLITGQSAQAAKYSSLLGLTNGSANASAVSQELAAAGLTSSKLGAVLSSGGNNGFVDVATMINQAMSGLPKGQREALWSKLFGGGRSDRTAMALAQGAMSGQLESLMGRLTGASTVGANNQAWKLYSGSADFTWKQLDSQLSALGVVVGKDLLPAFKALVGVLHPILQLASTRYGSDVVAGLLLGTLGKKALQLVGMGKLTGAGGAAADAEGAAAGEAGISSGAIATIAEVAVPIAMAFVAQHVGNSVMSKLGAPSWLKSIGDNPTPAGVVAGISHLVGANGVGNFIDRDLSPTGLLKGAFHLAGFAAGGALPAGQHGGFMTNGPVSIVGEGRQQYPEFVIPTDPQYRGRALGLVGQLAPRLMASGGGIGVSDQDLLRSGAASGLLSAENEYNAGLARVIVGTQLRYLAQLGARASATGIMGGPSSMSAAALASLAGGAQGGSVGANRALGKSLAASMYGWTGGQWSDLNQLVMKESGWNATAQNPTSSAFGIAQNIGGPAGYAGYGTSPKGQIEWMLSYIRERYGTPAAAWAHEQAQGYYASGGVLPQAKPLLFDAGGMLPEGISLVSNQTGAPEPLARVDGGRGGEVINLTAPVILDGKTIAEAVFKYERQKVARI